MCPLPTLLEKERDHQLLQSPPGRTRGCPVRQGPRPHVPGETGMPTPEPDSPGFGSQLSLPRP